MKKTALGLAVAIILSAGCTGGRDKGEELRQFPIQSAGEISGQSGVSFDPSTTSDGNGSLKIVSTSLNTVKLYQLGDIDIEDAFLVYEASLKTEHFEGEAYLEMWCSFPGKGEFFSRGTGGKLSGYNDWTKVSTVFRCEAGQNPDLVKLNVVAYGKGTVWIDEIKLIKKPLD